MFSLNGDTLTYRRIWKSNLETINCSAIEIPESIRGASTPYAHLYSALRFKEGGVIVVLDTCSYEAKKIIEAIRSTSGNSNDHS